jgi:hypothetical protein
MTYSCELDSLLFREVDRSRRPAFERLFECRGGPSMYGRAKLDLLQARVIGAAKSAKMSSSRDSCEALDETRSEYPLERQMYQL